MKTLLAVLMIGGFLVACTEAGCTGGYSYDGTYNVCYKYFQQKKNFNDANAQCKSDGGNLPSIHDSSGTAYVNMYWAAGAQGTWLGLQRSGSTWKWTDGTPYDFKADWREGYPDNRPGGGDCVYVASLYVDMLGSAYWRNWNCNDAVVNFICVKRP